MGAVGGARRAVLHQVPRWAASSGTGGKVNPFLARGPLAKSLEAAQDLDAVSRDGYEVTEESRFNVEDAEAELEAEQAARAEDAKWDAERSPEGDCNCRRCKP